MCTLSNEVVAAEFGDVPLIILSFSVRCFLSSALLLLVHMLEVTVIVQFHVTSLNTL